MSFPLLTVVAECRIKVCVMAITPAVLPEQLSDASDSLHIYCIHVAPNGAASPHKEYDRGLSPTTEREVTESEKKITELSSHTNTRLSSALLKKRHKFKEVHCRGNNTNLPLPPSCDCLENTVADWLEQLTMKRYLRKLTLIRPEGVQIYILDSYTYVETITE